MIKVCGMRDPENIRRVEALDIDCLGLIFYTPSPRYVSGNNEQIEAIGCCAKKRAGVFVNESPDVILEKAKIFQLHFLQLHGSETADLCQTLRQHGYFVIKTLSIASATDFYQTEKYQDSCDYFLFDTKCTGYGGSGKRFDWSLLAYYQGETPFLLSGGLRPDSMDELKHIKHPRWAGVDLNSGFELFPAMKDVGLLKDFVSGFRRPVEDYYPENSYI